MIENTLVIIASILVPMMAAFGWLLSRLEKIRNEINDVKTELKKEINDVKTELKEEINGVKVELGKLQVRVEERTLRRVVHIDKTGTEEK